MGTNFNKRILAGAMLVVFLVGIVVITKPKREPPKLDTCKAPLTSHELSVQEVEFICKRDKWVSCITLHDYIRSRKIAEDLLKQSAKNRIGDPLRIHALGLAAQQCELDDDRPREETLRREMIAIREQLPSAQSLQLDLAYDKCLLAICLSRESKYADAKRYASESLEIQEQYLPAYHPSLLPNLRLLADIAARERSLVCAEKLFQKIARIELNINGAQSREYRVARVNEAAMVFEQGRKDECNSILHKLRELFFTPNSNDYESLLLLAEFYDNVNNRSRALSTRFRILKIARAAYGENSSQVVSALGGIFVGFVQLHRFGEGQQFLKQTLSSRVKSALEVQRYICRVAIDVSNQLIAERKYQLAEQIIRVVVPAALQKCGIQSSEYANSCKSEILCLHSEGKYSESDGLMRKVLQSDGACLSATASALESIAGIEEQNGNIEKSISIRRKLIDVFEKQKDENGAYRNAELLTADLMTLHRYKQALSYAQKALSRSVKVADERSNGNNCSAIGQCYNQLQQWRLASQCFYKASVAFRKCGDRYLCGTHEQAAGMAFEKLGDPSHAFEHFSTAIKELEKIDTASARAALDFCQQRLHSINLASPDPGP